MLQQRSFYDPYGTQQAQHGFVRSAIGGMGSFAAVGGAMTMATGVGMSAFGATTAAATVIGVGAAGLAAGAIAGAILAPLMIGEYAGRAVSDIARFGRMARRTEFSTNYVDTRAAFTMRQQAMRFMHDTAYSLRASLGNEAGLFHS